MKSYPGNEEPEGRDSRQPIVGKTAGLGSHRRQVGVAAVILEILDALPFYILLVNEHHRIVAANAAVYEHLGLNPDDIIGQYCPRVVHGMDKPFPGCPLEESVETGAAVEREYYDAESERWMESAIYPTEYRTRDGTKVFFHTARDITERKNMEKSLLSLQRLANMGEFLGDISHELRDPLTFVDLTVEWLKMRLQGADDEVRKQLNRLDMQVDDCWSTIESLLSLAKMKQPRIETLDVISVACSGIATCEMPEGVKVVEKFLEEEVLVDGDREQLRIAFKNIVKNAVQAMKGKGTLTLTVGTTSDNQVNLCFADTGPGFDEETKEKILQPLFSTKAEGIGLGLHIARTIIERHGGTLEPESELGKGTTFAVRLPLHVRRGANG